MKTRRIALAIAILSLFGLGYAADQRAAHHAIVRSLEQHGHGSSIEGHPMNGRMP